MKLCYFGPLMENLEGETLQPMFYEYNLSCEQSQHLLLKRDYDELLANTLITSVTAESNGRESG